MISMAVAVMWLFAHESYAKECCENQHCHPVPCNEVMRTDMGWKWHGMQFIYKQLRDPLDGRCHVCHNATQPYCIYLPFGGET